MHLVVFSHKVCWPSSSSPTGYATDGGFPFQMEALSQLFDSTSLLVPCLGSGDGARSGEIALRGQELCVVPLGVPSGGRWTRKLRLPWWLFRNAGTVMTETRRAEAVHAAIPGDVGTVGMLAAAALKKPLFVRHCGNWYEPRTLAEHSWRWFMERFAGGRNVMFATGAGQSAPSDRNPHIQWIFSTSLNESELKSQARPRSVPESSSPRLIIVCRQEKRKGTDTVIRALPDISIHYPQVVLDVVGNGQQLPAYRRLAMEIGVSDRVVFHGKVSHDVVLSLLQGADLFCYPSAATEGFPKVVLEAMATGLPVLAAPVSALPQLLESGTGWLLPEVSASAVAEGVCACFENEGLYASMSLRSLETARRYSLENWRDSLGENLVRSWGANLKG